MDKEFLTQQDIMELLQIKERKAKALLRTEGCPSIKIGGEYRVEKDRFINWLYEKKTIRVDYSKT